MILIDFVKFMLDRDEKGYQNWEQFGVGMDIIIKPEWSSWDKKSTRSYRTVDFSICRNDGCIRTGYAGLWRQTKAQVQTRHIRGTETFTRTVSVV